MSALLDRADFDLAPHQGLIVDTCDCSCAGHDPETCQNCGYDDELRKDRAVCIGGYTYMLIDRRED